MRYRDYEEFVESLNRSGARYLIIGAHAVALHARPRATKDFDIYIEPTGENAERVLVAIREFLGSDLGLRRKDLGTPGRIVQLGVAPTRIGYEKGNSQSVFTRSRTKLNSSSLTVCPMAG